MSHGIWIDLDSDGTSMFIDFDGIYRYSLSEYIGKDWESKHLVYYFKKPRYFIKEYYYPHEEVVSVGSGKSEEEIETATVWQLEHELVGHEEAARDFLRHLGKMPKFLSKWLRSRHPTGNASEDDVIVNRRLGEPESDAAAESVIPPDRRTRPMSLKEAALLMGYRANEKGKKKGKQAAENLSKIIKDNNIRYICISRQRYIFDINDFPKAAHEHILPAPLRKTHPDSP
jgi:hypothetical protein